MIPAFDGSGNLPPGVHDADWREVAVRFAYNTQRRRLLRGLRKALEVLKAAGCVAVYVDGSFVTKKESPRDFDCCWITNGVDLPVLKNQHPVFFHFDNERAAQKAKYSGEFLPARTIESVTGRTFLELFQTDKQLGTRK